MPYGYLNFQIINHLYFKKKFQVVSLNQIHHYILSGNSNIKRTKQQDKQHAVLHVTANLQNRADLGIDVRNLDFWNQSWGEMANRYRYPLKWSWIATGTPRNAILKNNKIYSLNVSFMTFVKHMEWKLTATPLHEEKQPRVMLLRYAHWIHTFINPPYEFLKHFTTHKLIHLTWVTNCYNLTNTWKPWMLQPLRLSIKIMIVLLQQLE